MKENNKLNNQGKNQMKKYIVEAPEPLNGQKASSGGIREKGKITVQYCNPVPYEEPLAHSNEIETYQTDKIIVARQNPISREMVQFFIEIIWQEFAEPVVRSGLHKLGQIIVKKIEMPSYSRFENSSKNILESTKTDCETNINRNLYQFPENKVV